MNNLETMMKSYFHSAMLDLGPFDFEKKQDVSLIHSSTQKRMKSDCVNFYKKAKSLIESDTPNLLPQFKNKWELAGYALWAMQGRGPSCHNIFTDSDYTTAPKLAEIARTFEFNNLSLGKDNKLHGNQPIKAKKTNRP